MSDFECSWNFATLVKMDSVLFYFFLSGQCIDSFFSLAKTTLNFGPSFAWSIIYRDNHKHQPIHDT